MLWLINFFKELASGIVKVFEFLFWLIESIIETLGLCARALVTVGEYAAEMPIIWAAPFIAIVTIAIIFKVKG